MQRKRATLLLVAALLTPLPPAHADDAGAMFGLMFRMMLTMMNVMSGSMLGNNNGLGNNWLNNWNNGLGGFNSFNLGMRAFPAMAGMGSPWSSFGGMPWSGGGSPWSSWGNPWSSGWGNPWSGGWGAPYGGGYPGYFPGGAGPGRGGYGYPISYGNYRPGAGGYGGNSILDGRWYGNNGEILEFRGNRFRLQDGATGLNGMVVVNNNIVNMYSPQTDTVTSYTFVRNQTGLLMQDASGNVLTFTQYPSNGVVRVF
jgi:hypothetical protein